VGAMSALTGSKLG